MAKVTTISNLNEFPQDLPASKPSTAVSKPDIGYAKPLYYVSLIFALSCPINLSKYRAHSGIGHKLYSFLMMAAIIAISVFSFHGRLNTSYKILIQTVRITDIIEQVMQLISSVYAVSNVVCFGRRTIESYFQMMKYVDKSLITTMDLAKKKMQFYAQFIGMHVLIILLCCYDSWAWSRTLGMNIWKYYAFRLVQFYMNITLVLQVYTFSTALKVRFQMLNERLLDLSLHWIGSIQSHEAMAIRDLMFSYKKSSVAVEATDMNVRCLIRMHDMLCDVIGLVNGFFGFNIVFLVCNIIVNSVIAFNLTLIFGTGVQPSIGIPHDHIIALNVLWAVLFLKMGVLVSWACDGASNEARRTATIAYKLLTCIPTETKDSKERQTRSELYQLAQQVENRKPAFDAAGFFPVDHTMVYGIIGAISSYMVIIIQFNNSPITVKALNITDLPI